MKKYIPILVIAAAIVSMTLSCKREYQVSANYTGTGAGGYAFLKVVHASPNFATLFNVKDAINVYLDTTKINGSVLSFGVSIPATGLGMTYAAVQAGEHKIRLSLNGITTGDSSTIVTLDKTLAAGSYYTLVISDSIQNASRDSSRIWIQDNFPQPSQGPGYVYVRLMHAVQDGNLDTVDFFSSRRNQVVFTRIKIDSTTAFTAIPSIAGGGNDTFYLFKHSSIPAQARADTLAKVYTTSLNDQQYFTFYYIGDTSSTLPAAKRRTLVYNQNK